MTSRLYHRVGEHGGRIASGKPFRPIGTTAIQGIWIELTEAASSSAACHDTQPRTSAPSVCSIQMPSIAFVPIGLKGFPERDVAPLCSSTRWCKHLGHLIFHPLAIASKKDQRIAGLQRPALRPSTGDLLQDGVE